MADEGVQARAAVERAALETRAISGKHNKRPAIGPVRYNLEAFGVAILGAVLLKWFCIEAFAIPTSSMQPTLMGSAEAGVYDRLLVDKLTPVLREPQRWDVTVFSYPLQKNQNYVKRLVGLPGEKLDIAGGNLYRVVESEEGRTYEVLRKPDRIQHGLWKQVYPARLSARGEQQSLGKLLYGIPRKRAWRESEEPGNFTVDLEPQRSLYRLSFKDVVDGGFINRVFDGYPTAVAKAIRARAGQSRFEIVPDARIEAVFTPQRSLDELALEVEVRRPNHPTLTFALLVTEGAGKLQVRGPDGKPIAEHSGFACELPAGTSTQLGFAHLDDELIAYRDGSEVLRFDVAEFDCRQGCELPPGSSGATSDHAVVPMIRLRGQGQVAIEGLTIARDLHYTRICAPGMGTALLPPDGLIEIPDGHYFMMGDNTLQSVDSRGWTALSLGVRDDGTVIPPAQIEELITSLDAVRAAMLEPENNESSTQMQELRAEQSDLETRLGGARVIRGNARIVPPSERPDRDETPVVLSNRHMLAMIDENGETHALEAKAIVTTSSGGRPQLSIGENGPSSDWNPPENWVPFVPRRHIRGRALIIFWRWPFPRLSPVR